MSAVADLTDPDEVRIERMARAIHAQDDEELSESFDSDPAMRAYREKQARAALAAYREEER